MSDDLRESYRRYSLPIENIYRFSRVHVMPGDEVAAVFRNPEGDEHAAYERHLIDSFAAEQGHNERMPADLNSRSAKQIQQLAYALAAVQKHKMANGIPLDTPYCELKDSSVTVNGTTVPLPILSLL